MLVRTQAPGSANKGGVHKATGGHFFTPRENVARKVAHENIDNKFIYLEKNMDEKFNGVGERFHGIKVDISRLEHKQEESNKIKERLAVAEQAIKEITAKLNMNQIIDTYEAVKKDS